MPIHWWFWPHTVSNPSPMRELQREKPFRLTNSEFLYKVVYNVTLGQLLRVAEVYNPSTPTWAPVYLLNAWKKTDILAPYFHFVLEVSVRWPKFETVIKHRGSKSRSAFYEIGWETWPIDGSEHLQFLVAVLHTTSECWLKRNIVFTYFALPSMQRKFQHGLGDLEANLRAKGEIHWGRRHSKC